MPYIFVVDGKSAVVQSNRPSAVKADLEKSDNFLSLKDKCEKAGLKLWITPNRDDGEVAFFVGVELYSDRHIFQGLTVTLPDRATPDQRAETAELFQELADLLTASGLDIETGEGIVVSQFD